MAVFSINTNSRQFREFSLNTPTFQADEMAMFFFHASYANLKGRCWPKRETVCAALGITKERYAAAMKNLIGLGILTRDRERTDGGTFGKYIFTLTAPFMQITVTMSKTVFYSDQDLELDDQEPASGIPDSGTSLRLEKPASGKTCVGESRQKEEYSIEEKEEDNSKRSIKGARPKKAEQKDLFGKATKSQVAILEDEDFISQKEKDFPTVDVRRELRKAKNWLQQNGKLKKDYASFADNWLLKAEEDLKKNGSAGAGAAKPAAVETPASGEVRQESQEEIRRRTAYPGGIHPALSSRPMDPKVLEFLERQMKEGTNPWANRLNRQ